MCTTTYASKHYGKFAGSRFNLIPRWWHHHRCRASCSSLLHRHFVQSPRLQCQGLICPQLHTTQPSGQSSQRLSISLLILRNGLPRCLQLLVFPGHQEPVSGKHKIRGSHFDLKGKDNAFIFETMFLQIIVFLRKAAAHLNITFWSGFIRTCFHCWN